MNNAMFFFGAALFLAGAPALATDTVTARLRAASGEDVSFTYGFKSISTYGTSHYATGMRIELQAPCTGSDYELHLTNEMYQTATGATSWRLVDPRNPTRKIRLDARLASGSRCVYLGEIDEIPIAQDGYGFQGIFRQKISIWNMSRPLEESSAWLVDPVSGTHDFLVDFSALRNDE